MFSIKIGFFGHGLSNVYHFQALRWNLLWRFALLSAFVINFINSLRSSLDLNSMFPQRHALTFSSPSWHTATSSIFPLFPLFVSISFFSKRTFSNLKTLLAFHKYVRKGGYREPKAQRGFKCNAVALLLLKAMMLSLHFLEDPNKGQQRAMPNQLRLLTWVNTTLPRLKTTLCSSWGLTRTPPLSTLERRVLIACAPLQVLV